MTDNDREERTGHVPHDMRNDEHPWEEPTDDDESIFEDADLEIRQPVHHSIVLNNHIGGEPLTPLCPECEEELTLTEGPSGFIRTECGCDEDRKFEVTVDVE